MDSVISSWLDLVGIPQGQMVLGGLMNDRTESYFALVTLSDLHTHIVGNYARSSKAGVPHYDYWLNAGRLKIIDGPMIWEIVRDAYLRAFADPQSQTLSFVSRFVQFDNVYLGVVSAAEIRRLYKESGDAIFFENVRDFTGTTDVNHEIAETVRNVPHKLLALNNGIVFSALQIEEIDEHNLRLDRASIVNGCQTTVTLANTPSQEECYIQVKVVHLNESNESWQVTHAANFQNEIKKIDLDLARYIRPQVIRKMGYLAGVPVAGDNALDILDTFNRRNVTWRNVRIIFIGLFSRDPGNMFDVRWDLVNSNLLNYYFQSEKLQRDVFEVVFGLHKTAEHGAEATREWLDEESRSLFSRLLGDTRAPYMQFLGILALCALVDENIAEREEAIDKEITRMESILDKFVNAIENRQEELDYAYFIAFEKVVGDVLEQTSDDSEEIRRKMYNRITKQAKFTNLFRQVKLGITRGSIQKGMREN